MKQNVYSIRNKENIGENYKLLYEGWNFNSGNYSYLFTTDTK